MRIDILGESYTVTHSLKSDSAYGEVNVYDKTIRVAPLEDYDCGTDEERAHLMRKTIRHEIAHAFLDESGLSQYSEDETLVDWIAAMMPKMVEAMGAACAL